MIKILLSYCNTAFLQLCMRMDIMVFAKYPNGAYGPPTIVSIYCIPNMRRSYADNRLVSITYVDNSPELLYDVSSIWIPHEWKDEFELTTSGKSIVTFTRTFPHGVRRDLFSATGELVHSLSPSGFPLVTTKVEYFISPDTNTLDYRPIGDEIKYRHGNYPSRRSGE